MQFHNHCGHDDMAPHEYLQVHSAREILFRLKKVRQRPAAAGQQEALVLQRETLDLLQQDVAAAAHEIWAHLQDLYSNPLYRQILRQARKPKGGAQHDDSPGCKPLIVNAAPRFRGQVAYSACADASAKSHTPSVLSIDCTHLRLVGGKELECDLVTLPLRYLLVEVDAEHPCSFSITINPDVVQTSNAIRFCLHACTQEARNRWLCELAKRGNVPVTLQHEGTRTLMSPSDLAGLSGFDDILDAESPGRHQRLVFWI
jgi:hypothetical protein